MTKKLSEDELNEMLERARKLVIVDALYRHYKGNLYKVVDVAILTEEVGVGVIYRAQYGKNLLFVRPLDVWLEKTEYKGIIVERFSKV